MKPTSFCFLVLLSVSACSPAEETVVIENKVAVIPMRSMPNVEAETDTYWFCRNIDSAFQHPLSVRVLSLEDSIGQKEAERILIGLPKLNNLNTLCFFGQRNLNLEPFFEVLHSLDNLRELQFDGCNIKLLGKIQKLKKLEVLTLKRCSFQEVPISFLNDMNLKSLTIVGGDKGFAFSGRLFPDNSLEEFDIGQNNEKELNNQLYKLNNLQFLRISFSSLASITPAIVNLSKLKKLDLVLTPLSKDEGKIKALRQLLKGKCSVLTEQDIKPE